MKGGGVPATWVEPQQVSPHDHDTSYLAIYVWSRRLMTPGRPVLGLKTPRAPLPRHEETVKINYGFIEIRNGNIVNYKSGFRDDLRDSLLIDEVDVKNTTACRFFLSVAVVEAIIRRSAENIGLFRAVLIKAFFVEQKHM